MIFYVLRGAARRGGTGKLPPKKCFPDGTVPQMAFARSKVEEASDSFRGFCSRILLVKRSCRPRQP